MVCLNATCCVWWGLETTTKRTKQCGSDSDALLSVGLIEIFADILQCSEVIAIAMRCFRLMLFIL